MRYNVTFSIEKNGNVEKKFEVVECESNNREYVANTIAKKYEGYSINIKKITLSINGRGNTL